MSRRSLAVAGSLVALTVALSACTSSGGGPPSSPHETSSAGPSSQRAAEATTTYEVTASLLHRGGGKPTMACLAFLLGLSQPPAGCSGVAVRGEHLGRSPGAVHRGAAWWTGPLRLIGTWDGDTFSLTHRPTRAEDPAADDVGLPSRCVGQGPRATKQLGARITRAHERIHLLQLSPCGKDVAVLVAVKDGPTVDDIRAHFGDHVLIRGWLRPLR